MILGKLAIPGEWQPWCIIAMISEGIIHIDCYKVYISMVALRFYCYTLTPFWLTIRSQIGLLLLFSLLVQDNKIIYNVYNKWLTLFFLNVHFFHVSCLFISLVDNKTYLRTFIFYSMVVKHVIYYCWRLTMLGGTDI